MFKVLNVCNQRGWSACDHLIDDSEIQERMIGREYRSYRGMIQATRRLESRLGYSTVEYQFEGRRYRVGTEPSLPGRPNRGPREIVDGAGARR